MMSVCRACGRKNQLRRVSRKGLLEKTLLVLLLVRPFRCRFCHSRFYLFMLGKTARSCARLKERKRIVPRSPGRIAGETPDQAAFEILLQQIHSDELQMAELEDWERPSAVQKAPASR
jgi:hypothetical protein